MNDSTNKNMPASRPFSNENGVFAACCTADPRWNGVRDLRHRTPGIPVYTVSNFVRLPVTATTQLTPN
jgi:hypothetical protein